MYKLLIDSGNSSYKIALIEKGQSDLIEIHRTENLDILLELKSKFEIDNAIYSDVGGKYLIVEQKLKNLNIPCIRVSHLLNLPFELNYATKETLGNDRIAAVAALKIIFPDQNAVVIDSGTCITYDILDKNGVYQGGAISPGLQMRYDALHKMTSSLPELRVEEDYAIENPGKSTITSMRNGVLNGTLAEMQSFIDTYDNNFNGINVLIGGGNKNFFESKLKGNIFARENLILEGLSSILSINDSQ
jgi:type III pantothenate kinase